MNYGMPPQYQFPPAPAPENTGKDIWKVLRLQLGIFAAYQIGLAILCRASGAEGFILIDMLPLILHWLLLIILMIISFASKKKGKGLGYLISLIVTGIVGFGSCFLIADMIGSGFNVH